MRIEQLAEGVTLYCGDCREILPTLGKVDAVVTDPPYGIGADKKRGDTGRNKHIKQRNYCLAEWDTEPCPPEMIHLMRVISRHQIIFGGNYFELPPSRCWLVWDKKNGDNHYADCELAWTNLPKAVRKIEWLWHGMLRKGSDVREHPTQKPLGVMAWCLDQLPDDVRLVCDPFMGSGTTGVAAVNKGLAFIGIEREPAYFENALVRISESLKAPSLLVGMREPAPPAPQASLI